MEPDLAAMGLFGQALLTEVQDICQRLLDLPDDARIATLNAIRMQLHASSPFVQEPVDCVVWLPATQITANDYNPNAVAPPEMRLLEHSIAADGYTQPIVGWQTEAGVEVVDGFHRTRVGKESRMVRGRTQGYLPVTLVNAARTERQDRMAATIRHNRARGKHRVDAMSEIVQELHRRNWSDTRIGKELGMEPDEVLRLKQVSGLASLFADRSFSDAWEA